MKRRFPLAFCCLLLTSLTGPVLAQSDFWFTGVQRLTNQETLFRLSAPPGQHYRIDATTNLLQWHGLVTLTSTGFNQHADTAGPYLGSRFYRAEQVPATNLVTGDHLVTDDGEVIIHPINHATFVMRWNNLMIYSDPVGGATAFQGLPRANLILYTHNHGDHYNNATLEAVRTSGTAILAPLVVYNALNTTQRSLTTVLTNGATTTVFGIRVDAVPAYNFTASNHPRGVGNGYVLTIGNRRMYIAGDTEDIPEMRALRDIDVSFLPMNQPYTMTIAQALSAVQEFRPRVVYPIHYRNADSTYADLNSFKQQVGTDLGMEVRLRKWY